MTLSKRASFGLARLTILFLITIASASVYSAYKIIPFYYCYYDLLNHVEAVLKVAEFETSEQIRFKIYKRIKELGIPVCEEQLKVFQTESGNYRVELKYKELFYIHFRGKDYDIKEFPFVVKLQQKIIKKDK